MRKVLGEFFLDGAKIIFGSMVVGSFITRGQEPIAWITAGVGFLATVFFLILAINNTNRGDAVWS